MCEAYPLTAIASTELYVVVTGRLRAVPQR